MDWESFCIIDNKENKDITEDVINIDKDDAASRYKIRFYNNEATLFSYSLNRITYLKDPVAKDIGDQIVFVNGKIQSNIKAIRFLVQVTLLRWPKTHSAIFFNQFHKKHSK